MFRNIYICGQVTEDRSHLLELVQQRTVSGHSPPTPSYPLLLIFFLFFFLLPSILFLLFSFECTSISCLPITQQDILFPTENSVWPLSFYSPPSSSSYFLLDALAFLYPLLLIFFWIFQHFFPSNHSARHTFFNKEQCLSYSPCQ